MDTKELDERGFIFMDDAQRVYRVCMWGGNPWLFIWQHHNRQWMSVRKVSQMDVWTFPRNLNEEQQRMYFDAGGV